MLETKDWKLLATRSMRNATPVLCLANQKGGVGKTTVSVNLAAALGQRGRRVLVVDVDPQSNATTGLGIDYRTARPSAYDLLAGDASLDQATVGTGVGNVSLVPGCLDLAGAEVELVSADRREFRLATGLGDTSAYDLVLLDCPPSLGLLTINALVAATDLIAPVQCEYYALEGLGQLLATAERIRRHFNEELRLSGLLLTMYDARTRLSGQVSDDVRAHFGERVFRTVVPRSVRLSEAPSYGEPVLSLDPSSRGSIAFKMLAVEVEERYGLSDPKLSAPEKPAATTPTPGPRGRGYGTVAPEPPALDETWPRPHPFADDVPAPAGRSNGRSTA
jgi:chromosome partitioning protein